jgi:hypothetical protein
MKKKRDLGKLVELMKKNKDRVLVCVCVGGCLCHKRKFIIWQGKQGCYEETVNMTSYIPDNHIDKICDDHDKSLWAVPFDNLITYLGIESEVFQEFIFKFPLLWLMLRDNDRVMTFIDYLENENVRLWLGGNSQKFYFETSSAAYEEGSLKFKELTKKLGFIVLEKLDTVVPKKNCIRFKGGDKQ